METYEHQRVPTVVHHPRSPDASPETLRQLAGIISLTGPVPSKKFLEENEIEDQVGSVERDGD